jgi:hypothetical protein
MACAAPQPQTSPWIFIERQTMTTPLTDEQIEDNARNRMLARYREKYGDMSAIMPKIQAWHIKKTEFNDPWNRDREAPVTLEDVQAAEYEMLAAIRALLAQPAAPGSEIAHLCALTDPGAIAANLMRHGSMDKDRALAVAAAMLGVAPPAPGGDAVGRAVKALTTAVRQNSLDMLMTGEELRDCEAALAALQSTQAPTAAQGQTIPAGMALVPKRLTQAMKDVLADEWDWPDLLAAADAVTEDEHHALEVLEAEMLRVQAQGQDASPAEQPQDGELLSDTPTPKPQAGLWTLTAPDGRTYQADSPLRCCGLEQRQRVPADVAMARILRAASEPDDSELLDWLDATNKRFKMGWKVSVAPAGNCSVQSVIFLGNSEPVTIRAAIRAARAKE